MTDSPTADLDTADLGTAELGTDATIRAAFWLTVVLITFGTLFPFRFDFDPASAQSWSAFLSPWSQHSSLTDAAGNFLLFVPFGLFGASASGGRGMSLMRLFMVLAGGVMFALALQAMQLFMPDRDATVGDALWNAVGIVFGMGATRTLALWLTRYPVTAERALRVPVVLIVLWWVSELLPLLPSLDVQSIKNAVKPLILDRSISIVTTLSAAASVMVVGQLLYEFVGSRRSTLYLPLIVATLFAGKLIVVSLTLDVATVLGWLLGIGFWRLSLRTYEANRVTAIFFLLLTSYTLEALTPFEFSSTPQPFNWIPFADLLGGSMLNNLDSMLTRMFALGSALWLIHSQGTRLGTATAGVVAWVGVVEAIQLFTPDRTPSISDLLLVVLLAVLISRLEAHRHSHGHSHDAVAEHRPDQSAERAGMQHGIPQRSIPGGTTSLRNAAHTASEPRARATPLHERWLRAGIGIVLAAIIIAAAIWLTVRLPGVPYNVRELLRGDANLVACWVFAIALLWCGAGGAWLGSAITRRSAPVLTIIGLSFLVSLISLLLLMLSVTDESIMDVAGSTNAYWFVVNRDVWGETMRKAMLALDSPALVAFIERPVRYAALYSPLVIFIGIAHALNQPLNRDSSIVLRALVLLLCALPMLLLCKYIGFDYSSTDNLNELIARDGEYGLGGGGYLYLLVALISACAVHVAASVGGVARLLGALCIALLSLPVGWWLINMGLEPAVEKYGTTFSGVQFLLGPDREHGLDQAVLFIRFSAVYAALVVVLSAGIYLSAPVLRQADSPWLDPASGVLPDAAA